MRSVVWAGDDLEVTQPYGPDHRGIDIGMESGRQLYAARAGVVSAIGQGNLCLTVGDNLRDWYLHISAVAVALGQHVTYRQLVAFAGAVRVPGGPLPTGPHLHFEVQTGRLDVYATSLDPVPILTGLYGAGSDTLFDMTPEENQTLNAIYAILSGSRINGKATDQALHDLEARIGAGGATEPAEPPEPKTVTLDIPAQKITGTLA